jgi:hypothetical protein
MAGKKSRLDGVVTFYASHHAVRAEKVLTKQGYRVLLVPGPREISPNCGVALQFPYAAVEQVRDLLIRNRVQFEAIHQYRLEIDEDKLDRQ